MALEIHQSTVGTVMLSGDDISIKMIWNNIIGKNFNCENGKQEDSQMTDWMLYIDTVFCEDMRIPRRSGELFLVEDGKVIDEELRFTMGMFKRPFIKGLVDFNEVATIVPTKDGYKLELTAKADLELRKYTGDSISLSLNKLDDKGYRLTASYTEKIGFVVIAFIDTDTIPFDVMDMMKQYSPLQRLLKSCTIGDDFVRLPDVKLSTSEYQEVKKTLEGIGGKWNTQAQAFLFESDPTDLMSRLIEGEKVNLKQDFQFFATPKDLVTEMVKRADIKATDVCLEPSAGRGAIVEQLLPVAKSVDLCEFMEQNRDYLTNIGLDIICNDFLELSTDNKYDKIVANPPFTKNQDVDHVLKMYEHLNEGGKIVAIMSTTWKTGSQKKQVAFREFLADVGAIETEINSGTFKESGTNVKTIMVEITKKSA
jgi:hypothetical protein